MTEPEIFLSNLLPISLGPGVERGLRPLRALKTTLEVTGGNGKSTGGKAALRAILPSTSRKWSCSLSAELSKAGEALLVRTKAGRSSRLLVFSPRANCQKAVCDGSIFFWKASR